MSARERLTTAMAELMWERGYAATSPRDVLERAGVGQGSMYHHFASKHDLAVKTLDEVATEMTSRPTALDGDGSPLARIKAYLLEARPGTRGCRLGRMTQDPQVVDDPELIGIVGGAFDAMASRWAAAIREAVAAGELPADTVPEELAQTLQAVVQGGYVLARSQGSQEPMDAAVRAAVALLDAAAAHPDHR